MCIVLEKSNKMLNVTTQNWVCTAVPPIHRRYCVYHLELPCNRLVDNWSVNWILAKSKSISQCTGSLVYANVFLNKVHPKNMNQSISASKIIQDFFDDIGHLKHLISDREPKICVRNFAFLVLTKKRQIDLKYSDPEQSNQMWKFNIEFCKLNKWHHKNI